MSTSPAVIIEVGNAVKVTGRVAMKGYTGTVRSIWRAQYKNAAEADYAAVVIDRMSYAIQIKHLTKASL